MDRSVPTCKSFNNQQVEEVLSKLPEDDLIVELAEFLEAFADSTRIKILLALTIGELCTCDLSSITGLSVSAISHQLRTLRDKKIVKYRRAGRNVYYSLDDEHVEAILKVAMEHIKERRK
ncbi:transcriptional regulator, ArsR family [Ferroglobus placidus DSM 10642]|uniref:Transcriptional regulator, ArsR family n=1 Tax=Ferroglobus placidus (strain DSM 10642 / AEDII12DO) TaxID=589924 RepID=D3S1U7_FERPA|nr:metalloregulator ArsR/SmtB family transcription factor [Ferroglobus placidus]ADC64404.1 transcriptional regulator, ArsR family [Ferroglobus placidus DSM 10642]